MKRLAAIVLFLFVTNLAFAAVGAHCATGMPNPGPQSAAVQDDVAHDHADHDHPLPSKSPDQGDLCSSMQLAGVLAGVAMPGAPQVETTVVWTFVRDFMATDLSPVERMGIPPPPLIATGFDSVYARTRRLRI